jgi:hypothetical protein
MTKAESNVHTGGCQCGAVRYRFEGALGDASICHCRMCQKAFGSWGAPLVRLGFCGACGTPLYMRDDGDPNYEMAIGTLDRPNDAPPTRQVGVESELSWFKGLSGLPASKTSDENSPDQLKRYVSRQHPDHDTDVWPPNRPD